MPDGTEFLVTMGYVRVPRGKPGMSWPGPVQPGAVQRIAVSLRGAQQRARLERSRADLVSTVAHELRSPLTSVKGFTATLLAKWTRFTDDQKRVMLETVNADADRVTRLITELLDVSRIEAGRIEIHRQLVDIPQRAEKIVAGRVAAGDPPERFRVEVPAELPETWLDADKVDQILGNLVENAVRHGAGTVTIVVQPADNLGPRAVSRAGGPGLRCCAGHGGRGQRPRRGRRNPAGTGPADLPAVLAGQAARRGRAGPVHREGPGRGAWRVDHRAERTGRRRRVPIYHARRPARLRVAGGRSAAAAAGLPARCGLLPAPLAAARQLPSDR